MIRHSRLALVAALALIAVAAPVMASAAKESTAPAPLAKAVFAGGCFWCAETAFEGLPGVKSVVSGFAGGSELNPTYEQVSSGRTGHAESVEITFDPAVISYTKLLDVFWHNIDPTQARGQFCDHGEQYRSAIFYANDEQKRIAEAYIAQLNNAKVFTRPIVTQVAALKSFNVAEAYHQDYLANHPDEPYIVFNDLPKVENLRTQLPELYKAK